MEENKKAKTNQNILWINFIDFIVKIILIVIRILIYIKIMII